VPLERIDHVLVRKKRPPIRHWLHQVPKDEWNSSDAQRRAWSPAVLFFGLLPRHRTSNILEGHSVALLRAHDGGPRRVDAAAAYQYERRYYDDQQSAPRSQEEVIRAAVAAAAVAAARSAQQPVQLQPRRPKSAHENDAFSEPHVPAAQVTEHAILAANHEQRTSPAQGSAGVARRTLCPRAHEPGAAPSSARPQSSAAGSAHSPGTPDGTPGCCYCFDDGEGREPGLWTRPLWLLEVFSPLR
jgi:hypothetical protein